MSLDPAFGNPKGEAPGMRGTDAKPPMHPKLVDVLREMAIAPRDQKLTALQNGAMSLAPLVLDGTLVKPDVLDHLVDAAISYGFRRTDVEHVVSQGLHGRCAGVGFVNGKKLNGRGALSVLPAFGKTRVTAMNIDDFLAKEFPPREIMLAPWLPVQGLAMVHAPRGLGKTHFALGTAWAVHAGAGFLRWKAPQPRRVLLLDGEMPGIVLQERLKRIAAASSYEPIPNNFQIAAADLVRDGLPDLADPAAQQFYADVIADADLVVADNLSTLCRGLKENDADSWTPVQSWALSLRRASKSVLLFHHGGKAGTQRGTSRKEDVLDTVISLRKPPDYSADQGARFEVIFEKNRGFHGPEAQPFEARLIGDQWVISDIKSGDDSDTLKALRAQGMSIRDIADRTGLSKSSVQRRLGEEE